MRVSFLIVLCACGNVKTGGTVEPDGSAGDAAVADAVVDAPPDPLGPWGEPVRIDTLSELGASDSNATIRADGLELFFISNRDGGNSSIYTSLRDSLDSPWRAPTKVLELDVPSSTENGPDLSEDGKTIFFGRAIVGSSTITDLFFATRPNLTAPWEQVTRIAELRTDASEHAPHVSADGKTLYFGRDDGGTFDIYVATRSSTTSAWQNAREVMRFTSEGDDDNPTTFGDGQTLVFDRVVGDTFTLYSSTRLDGGGFSIPRKIEELAGGFRADVTPDGRIMIVSFVGPDGRSDLYESRR